MTFYNTHHHELKVTYLSLSVTRAHHKCLSKKLKIFVFPNKEISPSLFCSNLACKLGGTHNRANREKKIPACQTKCITLHFNKQKT